MQSACRASVGRRPLRVPGDLPDVAVRILEAAGVTAPERVTRGPDDRCARTLRLVHDRVHFGLRGDVMADRELGCARRGQGKVRIVRDAPARPEGELQAGLQFEKGHRTMLELLADDAFGLEPEAVAVEPQRPL